MRKITLAAAFFFMQLLFSCELFVRGIDCPDTLPYFTIEGLGLSHFNINDKGKVLTSGTPVTWGQHYMGVSFQTTYHANTNHSTSGAAFAYDCPINGMSGSRIGVDTLFVIALTDYNATYAAGDTLNNIVRMNGATYSTEDFDKFYTIGRYVAENRDGVRIPNFEWRLTEPPAAADATHRFRVVYRLRNGRTFQTDAEPVRLTR